MKRLIKKHYHDIQSRDSAVCFIDGNILSVTSHNEIIKNYIENILEAEEDFATGRKRVDSVDYEDYITEIAFGHIVENEKTIYMETDLLENVDETTTVEEFIKNKYPNYEVVWEDMYS